MNATSWPMDGTAAGWTMGLIGLAMFAVEMGALFGIVYAATRLAIRHERRRGHSDL